MVDGKEPKCIGKTITIWGVVQGVGFRPFVARIAKKLKLSGSVINSGGIVKVKIIGTESNISSFLKELNENLPPASKIHHMEVQDFFPDDESNFKGFEIIESEEGRAGLVFLPSDLSICEDCQKELLNGENRRYRHPMISCMNCGPRYSIIREVPYDRENTTMKDFIMCSHCEKEYKDPLDRRYHAQTISCHQCEPSVIYRDKTGEEPIENSIEKAVIALQAGKIIAVKGIGGYHFVCSPYSEMAVKNLRLLKGRDQKPFAVMFAHINEIKAVAQVSAHEEMLLKSPEKPIVLLTQKENTFSFEVCGKSRFIGAFLPYTSIQLLLLEKLGALIMTSANASDCPIIKEEREIFAMQTPFLEGFLYHHRPILVRMDDSVVRSVKGKLQFIRKARGYVPDPIMMNNHPIKNILALGGHLKSTFCLTNENFAYVSQYMGDMTSLSAHEVYHETLTHMKKLFRIQPDLLCTDTHPAYETTKMARTFQLPVFYVQHHYAHIASVMSEHRLDRPVIGIAFDGTGYGEDGTVWGGEFLYCTPTEFERFGHLERVLMTGGDQTIKDVWKIALAYKRHCGIEFSNLNPREELLYKALENNLNTYLCSSMGRLFDAVSALLSLCEVADYEGEAAILLENAAASWTMESKESFTYQLISYQDRTIIEINEMLREIENAFRQGDDVSHIAYRFHLTIAHMTKEMCEQMREKYQCNDVALSGGVFQNILLLDLCTELLTASGFCVYMNEKVPPNDGGISLGQAYLASYKV